LNFVSRLWSEHRIATLAGVALLIAAVALAGYLILKRPEDISNPDAAFEPEPQKKAKPGIDWPLYGGNPQRTRYLGANRLKPPLKVAWQFNGRKLLEYSPIVVDGWLYFVNNNGQAFSVKARTGKARWVRDIAQLNASAPTYDKRTKLLFVSNLEPGQVIALDSRTGRTRWRRALPGRTESSPVVVGDRVIAGCECGTLYAFKAKTGKPLWETGLGGEIKAAPAFSEGVVYVGDYGGQMSAVRASDGSVKWQTGSQGSSFGRAGRFYATPAVAFGRVYAGNLDGRMYSFEKDSGALAWTQSTGGYVYSAPAVADTPKTPPSVYFGSYDGTVYALDARNGGQRWSAPAGGYVSGAGSLIGETVYIANITTTETHGFDAASGRQVFSFRDGAYNPVISDGKRIYLTGKKRVYAMTPGVKREKPGKGTEKGQGGKGK